MKTDLIFKQQLQEILEGLKKEDPEDPEDIDREDDDVESYDEPVDKAGAKVSRGVKTFFSKKPEDEPADVKGLVKHGGYNIANAISSIPSLLLGKENIFFKAANFMKNPDIIELFKWSNVSKKSKDFPYEPVQGDGVYISGIPGAKRIRVGSNIANLYGKIESKKVSVRKYYYNIKLIYPGSSKTNIISAQLDFSTLRSRPGKLFLILKNGKQKVYAINVASPQRHSWNVTILTDVDVTALPESPGLDDTTSIASAGMMLNGYLGIKDWKTLGKDTPVFMNLLIKIAAVLKDPKTKNKTLKQINDLMVTVRNTEEFKTMDNNKKINTLNNMLQSKISSMRGA